MNRDDELLVERARKLAQRRATTEAKRLVARAVIVDASGATYGLPVTSLREIVPATPIAQLPGLPAFLLGLAAVRGELMCVADLGELSGRGRTGTGALFAVVQAAPGSLALCIEQVLSTRDIFEDEVAEGLSRARSDAGLTCLVTRDLVSVVDVDQLLTSARLVVGKRDEQVGELPHE